MKKSWDPKAIGRGQRAAAQNGTSVPKYIREAQSRLDKQK